MVEHSAVNRRVVGSSPTGGVEKSRASGSFFVVGGRADLRLCTPLGVAGGFSPVLRSVCFRGKWIILAVYCGLYHAQRGSGQSMSLTFACFG